MAVGDLLNSKNYSFRVRLLLELLKEKDVSSLLVKQSFLFIFADVFFKAKSCDQSLIPNIANSQINYLKF